MDTKLKSYKPRPGFAKRMLAQKVIAFIICIAAFTAAVTGIGMTAVTVGQGSFTSDLLRPSVGYLESENFQEEFNRVIQELEGLYSYKGEEYISSGKTVDEENFESQSRTMFYNELDFFYRINGQLKAARNGEHDDYNDAVNSMRSEGQSATQTETSGAAVGNNLPDEEYIERDFGNPEQRAVFEQLYAKELKNLRINWSQDSLMEYRALKNELAKVNGLHYYVSDGTYVNTNMAASSANEADHQLTLMKAYLIYRDGKFDKMPGELDSMNGYDLMLERSLFDTTNPGKMVMFGFDNTYITAAHQAFENDRVEMLKWIPMIGIGSIVALISFIYLIVVTGRKDEEGNVILGRVDRWFTELRIVIPAGAVFFGLLLNWDLLSRSSRSYYNGYTDNYYESGLGYMYHSGSGAVDLIGLLATIGIALGVSTIALYFFLSLVRSLKARRFLKDFAVWKLAAVIKSSISSLYHSGSVTRKVALVVAALCLISGATFFFAPIVAVAAVFILLPWIKKYEAIKTGVGEMKDGNLSYRIPVEGHGELIELAENINQIGGGFNAAVQNELKNQRMKTDLISNVSHDLKTPLTSIITYVDLLKKEGFDSPNAPKYLDVLEQKSQRLKNLTEDLFEAAKASSGAMPVNLERVELMSLVNQGLGEMGDRIIASGLEFRVKSEADKYYVEADGKLLWRVVENLFGNVLKYALKNSRVYIDLKTIEKNRRRMAMLEVKNVSANELNIAEDELMERFKRGDESRTTEGSGLGLAIAKDLVRLQNGIFEIKIDGDLFKAIVMLDLCQEPVKKPADSPAKSQKKARRTAKEEKETKAQTELQAEALGVLEEKGIPKFMEYGNDKPENTAEQETDVIAAAESEVVDLNEVSEGDAPAMGSDIEELKDFSDLEQTDDLNGSKGQGKSEVR